MIGKLLNVILAILTVCVVGLTLVVIKREFFPSPPPGPSFVSSRVPDWKRYASEGQTLGASDAPVTIVEFSDFQCPFCRRLASTLKRIHERYPGTRLVYRHFPLPTHSHAFEAAVASECAAGQAKFWEFHDVAFGLQDSLGMVSWDSLARRAGVAHIRDFHQCLSDPRIAARVQRDVSAGERLGVDGTPTVIVNDLRLPGTPPESLLDRLTRNATPR